MNISIMGMLIMGAERGANAAYVGLSLVNKISYESKKS